MGSKKIDKKTKVPRKSYSEDFKIRALLLFQSNNFLLGQTSKELGVSRNTLKSWRDKIGDEVFKGSLKEKGKEILPDVREQRIGKVRKDYMERESDYIDTIYDIREAAAERLSKIVAESKDIKALNDTLRTAQEIITGEHIKSLEERKVGNKFFQTVINQYQQVNNINEHIVKDEARKDSND